MNRDTNKVTCRVTQDVLMVAGEDQWKGKVKTAARQADDDAIEAMFRPRAGVIFNFKSTRERQRSRLGERDLS